MRRHELHVGDAARVARQRLPCRAPDVNPDYVNEAVLREGACDVACFDAEVKAADKDLVMLQLTLHAGHRAEGSGSMSDPKGSQSA